MSGYGRPNDTSAIDALTELESAYLAGLLDGEGCFCILASGKWRNLRPEITLVMKDVSTVARVADLVGISYFPAYRKVVNPKWAKQWKCSVTGRKSIALCRRIQPYSLTKIAHVEQILRFPATYLTYAERTASATAASLKERLAIKAKLAELNRLGPAR